jgi:GNAT superfamily N-acetyltransferase
MINRLVSDYHAGENRFDNKGEKLIGYSVENKIVGVCGLNVEPTNGKYGRLRRLYVLPEYRNCGIGTSLVKYLVEYARTNFEGVTVNIGELHVDKFYQSIGFESISHPSFTHLLVFPPTLNQ